MLLSSVGKSFYGKDGLQRLKRFRGFFKETNGKESAYIALGIEEEESCTKKQWVVCQLI
jgi:hypothetical protein